MTYYQASKRQVCILPLYKIGIKLGDNYQEEIY